MALEWCRAAPDPSSAEQSLAHVCEDSERKSPATHHTQRSNWHPKGHPGCTQKSSPQKQEGDVDGNVPWRKQRQEIRPAGGGARQLSGRAGQIARKWVPHDQLHLWEGKSRVLPQLGFA
eukprot:4857418-Amphidinium_carterae.1